MSYYETVCIMIRLDIEFYLHVNVVYILNIADANVLVVYTKTLIHIPEYIFQRYHHVKWHF